jgi:hypothetical protein
MTEPQVLDLTAEQPAEDRLFALPQRSYRPEGLTLEETTERTRERWRGWLATSLMGLLAVVVVGTFAYITWLSTRFTELSMDNLITVTQTVGTTLLAPLIGLIGAVTGFYFGGQTATQAASQTARTATQVATQTAQTATDAARAAGEDRGSQSGQ